MKLIRTLAVSEREFYTYLEQEMLADYVEGGAVPKLEKGAVFHNGQTDPYAKASLRILDYQPGKLYHAQLSTFSDEIKLSYRTRVIDDQHLEVIYQQELGSLAKQKRHPILSWFSDGVYLGRMTDHLYDIQKKIQAKREATGN